MSDITLSASMRSNLSSLQKTQGLMDMTQERLSTGKKVNSAIDNPSSYYTAQSLNNRASDLSALLDSMGQAVQTIKAANQGIETITKFAEQAKAVANSAMDSSDMKQIASSQKEFNELLSQLDQVAKDSGYKGVNLLDGDDLTVIFNEVRTSDITVKGEKADSASLGFTAANWDTLNQATTDAQTALDTAKAFDINTDPAVVTAQAAITTFLATGNSTGAAIDPADIATWDAADQTAYTALQATKTEKLADAQKTKDADIVAKQKTYDTALQASVKANKANILASVKQAEAAISSLRSMASTFGNNYSIVQNRQEFTDGLVNVLTEGADNLTLADMNEESANMLALQTRQQLAINSLSLASQASQAVLKLF